MKVWRSYYVAKLLWRSYHVAKLLATISSTRVLLNTAKDDKGPQIDELNIAKYDKGP